MRHASYSSSLLLAAHKRTVSNQLREMIYRLIPYVKVESPLIQQFGLSTLPSAVETNPCPPNRLLYTPENAKLLYMVMYCRLSKN